MNENTNRQSESNVPAQLQLDLICDAFESAWKAGQYPSLKTFADQGPADNRALLEELVVLDLAYRWKRADTKGVESPSAGSINTQETTADAAPTGQPIASGSLPDRPMLEDYLAAFPQLGELHNLPIAMICDEYRIRRTAGQRPEHADYFARFRYDAELKQALRDIDRRDRRENFSATLAGNHQTQQRGDLATCDVATTTQESPAGDESNNAAAETGRLGGFELLEVVGSGAFGTVYRARDPKLDRIVAIKTPRDGSFGSGQQRERFVREGRAVAQIRHPGIIPVFEVGDAETTPYIVSEFVEGETLEETLSQGALSPQRAAEIFVAIAQALDHAHLCGVVHRDLKPSNVMIDADGRPRVMDFGLAKRLLGEESATIEGDMLGTPAYMSPEQARGEAHLADRRTDVYALGVILAEALTGKRPFTGQPHMVLNRILNEPPPRLRALNRRIPKDLEIVCHKCLEKDPRERYQTAGELADDLRRVLRGEPIQARAIGPVARLARWAARYPTIAGLLAAVVVLLVAGSVVSLYFAAQARSRARQLTAENFVARSNLYAAQINLAQREWELGRTDEVLQILLRQQPASPQDHDFRGFEWRYLYRLCHSELYRCQPVDGSVQDLAVSSDGRRLISIHQNRGKSLIIVWDAQTGDRVKTLGETEQVVNAIDISPDGTRLATAGGAEGEKGHLIVWDLSTGKEVLRLADHDDSIRDVAFSPNGLLLASGCADKKARIFSAGTGRQLHVFDKHKHVVNAVAFHPLGQQLATACGDNIIRLWNVEKGTKIKQLTGHTQAIHSVCYRQDGQQLASAGLDGTIRLWDLSKGEQTQLSHYKHVSDAVYHSDGKRLVFISDQVIQLQEIKSEKILRTYRGSLANISCFSVFPDGSRFVSGDRNGNIQCWSMRDNSEFTTLAGHSSWSSIRALAFTSDSKQLVTAGKKDDNQGTITMLGEVVLWDAETGKKIRSLDGHRHGVHSLAISPHDTHLVTAGGVDKTAGECILWNLENGNIIWERKDLPRTVQSVCFSPDGKRIALAEGMSDWSGVITICSVEDSEPVYNLMGPQSKLRCAAFSPDGLELACVNSAGILIIWDLSTRKPRLSWEAHRGTASHVAFSPDGRLLVSTGQQDGAAKVWDVRDGKLRFEMLGSSVRAWCAAFNHDSRRLVTADERTVRIWDMSSGRQLLQFDRGANAVCFSPDGARLAAVGYPGFARLWDSGQRNQN